MPFTLRRTQRLAESAPSRSPIGVSRKESYATPIQTEGVQPKLSVFISQRLTQGLRYTQSDISYRHTPHRITQLPAEILAHIFALGAEDDVRLPVVVSHVSRVWRVVALQTPSLWQHVSLDSRSRMWTERIQRAKACPLDIEICPDTQTGRKTLRRNEFNAQSIKSYMNLAVPLIPRWRSLRIEFQHYVPYLWNAALSACCIEDESVEAPSLEHILLVNPLNEDGKEFLLFNGYTPQLRSATLHGIRLAWLPSLFDHLTTLNYTHHGFTHGYDAFAEIFGMLQVSSCLQDLRLSFPPSSPHALHSQSLELPEDARIYMDNLITLTLHIGSEELPFALVQLMSRLRLRNLRNLSLLSPVPVSLSPSHRHYLDPRMIPATYDLRTFFEALPRLPELNSLRIEHYWCESTFVKNLLKFHVPQLKHLALVSAHVNDQTLRNLGEDLRGRNYYAGHLDMEEYIPGVWHSGAVTLSTLDVLEIGEARISSEGLAAAVRRMVGGGIHWVQEVRVKDCKAVDNTAKEKAAQFGVAVRVWNDGVEVQEVGSDDSPKRRNTSVWERFSRYVGHS